MSPFVPRQRVRRSDRVLARGVLLVLLAVYTATFVGLPDGPQAELEFQTTSALARTRDLALTGTPEADLLVELAAEIEPGDVPLRRGPGARQDRWYAIVDPGQPLVSLPFYALGDLVGRMAQAVESAHAETAHGEYYDRPSSEYFAHLLVGWRNPLFGALTAWLIVLSARRMQVERRYAWLAALTYGLTTFAWPQARSSLSGVQETFLLFFSFHQLLRIRAGFQRLEPPSSLDLIALGTGLGLALLSRVALLPAVLVVAAAAEIVLRREHMVLAGSRWARAYSGSSMPWRAYLALLGPIVGAVVLLALVDSWRFGSPMDAGPAGGSIARLFTTPSLELTAGLMISPGRGLLWMAPLVVLVPLGLVRSRARGEMLLWRTLVGVFLATLLAALATRGWHDAWSYGPREMLPALPFLWVAVALGLPAAMQHLGGRILVRALILLGLCVQLPGVLVDRSTYLDLGLPAAELAWPDQAEAGEREMDELRFDRMHWDLSFAAPWAHWRILRHRYANLGSGFDLRWIFGVESAPRVLEPSQGRMRGARHVAWIDWRDRLGGETWALLLLVSLGVLFGARLCMRVLDPTAP